jgi:hypothetical protein
MKRSPLFSIIKPYALMLACLALATPSRADVAAVVNQVSQTNYQHYLDNVLYTRTGDDRGLEGAQHDMAQTNLFNLFVSFGLQTRLESFTYQDRTCYNVVGVLPGTTSRSNECYLVGAHYDSVNNPGADDNASGVAGVLEAARVLSQYQFGATLVFIAFDAEEVGLLGSKAYASNHLSDAIGGMISLDMISFNTLPENQAGIYGWEASSPIKLALSNAIALYGNGLTSIIGGPSSDSDHDSFENMGFQACLLIETSTNLNYHQAVDTVDTAGYIDYAFATKITRATVGYLATQAGLVTQPAAPVTLSLSAPVCRPDGRFAFALAGEPAGTYMVQSSTNLTTWTDLRAVVLDSAPVQVLDDIDPSQSKKFYRVIYRP